MMASFLYLSSESHLIPKWRHTQNAWAVGGVSEVLATLWVLTSHQPLGIHAAWGAPPPAPVVRKMPGGKPKATSCLMQGLAPWKRGRGGAGLEGWGCLGGGASEKNLTLRVLKLPSKWLCPVHQDEPHLISPLI